MATRLRHTFKYKADDDLLDHDDMDETEQDNLITSFAEQNQSMNDIYIRVFTGLPLAIIPVFLFHLVAPGSIGTVRLLSLLSLTSLAGSAFRMWFVPYSDEVGGAGEVSGTSAGVSARTRARANGGMVTVRRVPSLDLEIDHDGPLGRMLPYLNIGICAVLVVSAWGVKDRKDVPVAFWMFCLLPAMVLGIIAVVRQSMSDVDKGLGELNRLRYDYKGA